MIVEWRERLQLLDVNVLQCDPDAPNVKSQLATMAQSLGAVTRGPENVSCGGLGVDVLMSIDRCPI